MDIRRNGLRTGGWASREPLQRSSRYLRISEYMLQKQRENAKDIPALAITTSTRPYLSPISLARDSFPSLSPETYLTTSILPGYFTASSLSCEALDESRAPAYITAEGNFSAMSATSARPAGKRMNQ